MVLRLRTIRQTFTTRGRQVLALDNVSLHVQRRPASGPFYTVT